MYIVSRKLNDMLNKSKKNHFKNKEYSLHQSDDLTVFCYSFHINSRADKRYKLLLELSNSIKNKINDIKDEKDTGSNNG